MTHQDLHRAAHLMTRHGGSFAAAIAAAYFAADTANRAKLTAAFGDLFRYYLRVYADVDA